MTASSASPGAWTCPFCPLACDHLAVQSAADGRLMLQGSNCARASRGLAACADTTASPSVDGQSASLDAAIAAAAARLAASRQPLFAGLGTDVAGARALVHSLDYRGSPRVTSLQELHASLKAG